MRRPGPLPWLKPGVFVGALVPVGAIVWHAWRGELGANPIAQALNQLGLMALVFLLAALACTPLKTFFGWTWPIRLRRMLGLFGFFYALLHVSTYAGLDQLFDWQAIWDDVAKRKFIFVGFSAFVLLVPLAATSTSGALKRLGYARWKRLRRDPLRLAGEEGCERASSVRHRPRSASSCPRGGPPPQPPSRPAPG